MPNTDKYCGCLYFTANALSRVMTRMADEAFATTGLSPSHAFVLMSVNDSPGIQPGELSRQMQLTPSTVTRLVEKLEGRGLVERQSAGKATQVLPTAASKAMQPKLKACWKSLYERYAEVLGKDVAVELTGTVNQARMKLEA